MEDFRQNLLSDDMYSENKSNNDDDVKDNNKAMEFDSDDEDNNAGYVDANIAARTGSINDDVIRQDEEVEPYQLWETQIKEIIIDIFTKNYPFLFFCFIFGLSIGFIVYIFTTKKWYMTILSIVSIIAGLLYDEYHFKDKRKAEGNPLKWKPYDQTVDDGSTEPWRKSNDDEFYIESKFYSRTTGKQRGVTRIYRKANTHALTIQTRFGNEEYAGFEIGGGIAYIVGIPVFVVAFLGTDLLTAILGVYFALVLAGLVGCLIEMSLRKWGWLHPLGYRQTRTQSFALHEIAHVDTYTVGLHKTIRRLRQTSWIFEIISWFFYAVSFILLSPVFIVKYMIKFIYLNPIFVLWLFHFVATMILFEIQYIKESDPLKALAWLLPFNFLFSLYCLYLFASSKPEFTCNARFGCKLKQILYTRVPANAQKLLLIFYNADNIYTVNDVSDAGLELCDTTNFELLSLSLLILSIVWYILLGGWLYMWQNDTIGFKKKNIGTNTWLTHTTVSISLKSHKWYSNAIDIPLTYETAQKLHDFIVSNGAWYNQERNISNGSM